MSALVIRGLRKDLPGRILFADLALALGPGELVAIMGESGAGKSTLLNLVAGLERPAAGSIVIDGTAIETLTEPAAAALRRRAIGFVFQAFHVLPYLTVAENVAVPLDLNDWPRTQAAARVTEMLAAVGLAGRAAARPHELSGGELQRVAVARALAHRPRLVLADEPTGNLDAASADAVLALLAGEIARQGAAGILVTHSPRAAQAATRILELGPWGLRSVASR